MSDAPTRSQRTPLVLLYGEDALSIADRVREIRAAVVPNAGLAAFNHERFDGPYTRAIEAVISACRQLPVMAPRRLVELSAVDDFGRHVARAEGDVSSPADAIEALCAYAETPVESTTLVVTAGELRSNSRLVKAFAGPGIVERFGAADEQGAAGQLVAMARARGVELAADASRALVDALGTEVGKLWLAVERARDHAGTERVTVADVRQVVVDEREADVFALVEAIAAGQSAVALEVLRKAFGTGERDAGAAARVVALLIRQIRLLWTAKHVGANAGELGVPPFVATRLARQAGAFSHAQLGRAHRGLYTIDLALKGAGEDRYVGYHAPLALLQRWTLDVVTPPHER